MMSNQSPKTDLLFDAYKNIKSGTEILSIEDLEDVIETMKIARDGLKEKEQRRLQEVELEELKKKDCNLNTNKKVLYLPKEQKRINSNEFKNNQEITKVVINRGLTEIGEYAFSGCTNLREIVFPDNRIILRRGCFKDCTSIKEIDLPDVANICPEAFENCVSLRKVVFPWTISNIYSRAFKNCRSLEHVSFKTRISYYISIFPNVFENCISLKTIELPENTWFDSKSFTNCSNLKTIYTHRTYHKKLEKCDAQYVEI